MRSKSASSAVGTGSTQRAHGRLEVADKMPPEADVGHDLPGSAVLVDDLGAAVGGQVAGLAGFLAVVDGSWFELEVEFDGLFFQFDDLDFHTFKSVRRGSPRVKRAQECEK